MTQQTGGGAENRDIDSTDQPVNEKLDFLRKRLSETCIAARQDLSTSRHIFRGKPSYIVHDPVTFNSSRFAPREYHILASLNRSQTLSKTFAKLVEDGMAKHSDEQAFYEFILNLQARGLLDLPVTDSQKLYERHQKINEAKKANVLARIMFLKIPIVNPNNFLDRTIRFAQPLFTKWFFAIWCVMILASLSIIVMRLDDFVSPFADILATRNILILVGVMTALKIWHEAGHAYACKIAGGIVPDMGAFFMLGMPMAYVDVSSSWSFPSQRSRMLVGLGGMYFESIAGAIAVFVWAGTAPGVVNSTAHFVVLMASFMTILFNANPLMRYDGYYILSDMLGIPNLRSRSNNYLKHLFKRIGLGLPLRSTGPSNFERMIFVSYGISACIYLVTLTFSIVFMIATQSLLLGIIMGGSFLFTSTVKPVIGFFKYLLNSDETQTVKKRATLWAGGLATAALATVSIIPLPGGTVINGQLGYEKTQIVRMPFDCFLNQINVQPNDSLEHGTLVMAVENSDIQDQFRFAAANLRRSHAVLAASPDTTSQHQNYFQLLNAEKETAVAQSYARQLTVTSEFDGKVLTCPQSTDVGQYYQAGMALAKIGGGATVVKCLLDSDQWRSCKPALGQEATVRLVSGKTCSRTGKITRIEPAGSKLIQMEGLTQIAAGNIVVNPATGLATQPYFLIEVTLQTDLDHNIPAQCTAKVLLGSQRETIGNLIVRRARLMFTQLNANN